MIAQASRRPQIYGALVLVPLLLVAAWGLGTLLAAKDAETVRAAVILSVLVVVSLCVFWLAARSDPAGPMLFTVLCISFGLKLLAVYLRFAGRLLADAIVYDQFAAQIAAAFGRGQWAVGAKFWGTEFIRIAGAFVYYLTGTTFYGISVLWAWFGLLGMLMFYKAFTITFPAGNRRLFMLLIFLYPSLLLWTGSLGKDALMLFFLGMGAYGAARVYYSVRIGGVLVLAAGIGGMLMVRPHLAAVFAVAFGASFLTRPIHAGLLTPVIRLVSLIALVVVSAAVVSTAAGFVGLESLESQDVFQYIEVRQARTARGGSAFGVGDPRNPLNMVVGLPTVLFRPFPWEAHNLPAAVASVESMILLALVLYRWGSIKSALGMTRRNGYLLMIVVYTTLFVFFFSAIANFGIIARQRVQLYPFVFMLVAFAGRRAPAGPAEPAHVKASHPWRR
jgi:hypothetical protein